MSETKAFEELFFSYNADTHYSITNLKILIISNINSNTMYLERIKEWQLKQNIYFDIVLFVGNFTEYVDDEKKYDKENECRAEAKVATMVAFIENLTIPLIYMAGKNDPDVLFNENPPSFTIKSKNCFNNYYRVADDLYIIGQGGYVNEEEYTPEEHFQKISEDIDIVKSKIKKENSTPNIKYIFLSFDEPKAWLSREKDINDNEFYFNDEEISMGTFLNERDIIINIHQNYQAKGITECNGISIINSGELEKGNFAILDLERNKEKNNIWKIKDIQFLTL